MVEVRICVVFIPDGNVTTKLLKFIGGFILFIIVAFSAGPVFAGQPVVTDSSPLSAKAKYFQQDLLDKHWLDGLYVSIVPSAPMGTKLPHTVNEPGNVIHAGVWTGRYLAGVGYQYAVTRDPWVRRHGGEILRALRIQQEMTGKPGLLARGYVKGHGPVEGWERDGQNSPEWHQGQGQFADYRWHGDVSVDNFNAVLYGYAIYHDLAADAAQKEFIGRPPLRSSLMLLPDLLIAHHITGKARYLEFYRRVVERFKDNPDVLRDSGPFSLERLARVNHSSEGQSYEALYNLIRYEKNPELLKAYRKWVEDLWEMNWMEGNSLFTWMTRALLPEYRAPKKPGVASAEPGEIPHGDEATGLALETLRLYSVDRVLRPVMNSLRADLERNPFSRGESLSAHPIPINRRPLDNEYVWKGNPYQLDGWLKPTVTMFQFAGDDPLVAWFCDTSGRLFMTLDGGKTWRDLNAGLRGANVQNILASSQRTFVLHAQTDQGVFLSRDGGLSWRPASDGDTIKFQTPDFKQWLKVSERLHCRISEDGKLLVSLDQGQTGVPSMKGWRIPRAASVFATPRGIIASGPGGCCQSREGETWTELKLWSEHETGAADFLHAYWMGRYYGFVPGKK